MSYLDEFLKLKCAGDVLNVCNPINKAEKEISESMAMVRQVKGLALSAPMQYTMLDLCCGTHALTGVLAAHLLPLKKVIAVDIKPPRRDFSRVKRFEYLQADVLYNNLYEIVAEEKTPIIATATHACGNLATTITSQALRYNYKLLLMPCCKANLPVNIPQAIIKKIGKYLAWSYSLAQLAGGDLIVDDRIKSPCNAIVRTV